MDSRVRLVDVAVRPDPDRPYFPRAAVATGEFVARARVGTPDEIVSAAYGSNPDSARLDLLGHASPELLRRLRQVVQGFEYDVPNELMAVFAAEVRSELESRFP